MMADLLGLVEDLGIDSPLAALQEEYQNVLGRSRQCPQKR